MAGEKCCCRVENAGRFNCDSARAGLSPEILFFVVVSREGGCSVMVELSSVEEDFVRECPVPRAVDVFAGKELADGFRRCREAVSGGLERSTFTGSVLVLAETRVDEVLCSPPAAVAGLIDTLFRFEGGRIDMLEDMFSLALGGFAYIETGLAVLTVGSREGDCG